MTYFLLWNTKEYHLKNINNFLQEFFLVLSNFCPYYFFMLFLGELTSAPHKPSSPLSPVVDGRFHLAAAPFVHPHLPAGHHHRLGFSPHVGLSWWWKNITSQESCWLKQMMSWRNPIPPSPTVVTQVIENTTCSKLSASFQPPRHMQAYIMHNI